MHLNNLHIEAFRGLRDVRLEGLGPLNIFVGENNSGKTSILEACYLFFNPLNFHTLYRVATQRESMSAGLRVSSTERLHRIKWLFPHFKTDDALFESNIEISGDGNVPLRHYHANIVEEYGIPSSGQLPLLNNDANKEDDYDIDSVESEEIGLRIKLSCDPDYGLINPDERVKTFWDIRDIFKIRRYGPNRNSVDSTFVEPHGHRIYGVYKRLYSDIYKMDAHQDLISLLQQYDSNITELVILEDDTSSSLHVKHNIVGIAPISVFGDGLRRVLYIAMRLISAKNGVCFLDEIDNSIHVSALEQTAEWIVRTARQLNVQLFITTHNLEALDAFVSTSMSDGVVAYNVEDCGRSCRRYGSDLLHSLRYDRGLDVR